MRGSYYEVQFLQLCSSQIILLRHTSSSSTLVFNVSLRFSSGYFMNRAPVSLRINDALCYFHYFQGRSVRVQLQVFVAPDTQYIMYQLVHNSTLIKTRYVSSMVIGHPPTPSEGECPVLTCYEVQGTFLELPRQMRILYVIPPNSSKGRMAVYYFRYVYCTPLRCRLDAVTSV